MTNLKKLETHVNPQKCEHLKRILSNHISIQKILFYFQCHVLYAVAVCENILIAKALGDRVASISEFCRIFSFATWTFFLKYKKIKAGIENILFLQRRLNMCKHILDGSISNMVVRKAGGEAFT